MARLEFEDYLKTDEGRQDAERFCKALTEGRLLAKVLHVSSSGLSRVIALREIRINEDPTHRVWIWNFNRFAEIAGFPMHSKYEGNKVQGCGMNMVFHMISRIAEEIKYCTAGELDCTRATDNYLYI